MMVEVVVVVFLVVCLSEGSQESPESLSAVIPREAGWSRLAPHRASHHPDIMSTRNLMIDLPPGVKKGDSFSVMLDGANGCLAQLTAAIRHVKGRHARFP